MHAPSHPLPRPVRTSAEARYVLSLAAGDPMRPETLAFLLDPEGMGGLIVVIADTIEPDAALDVAELMARVGERVAWAQGLVLATVRPNAGLLPGDVDRWLDASAVAARHGIQLIEWYVIGPGGAACPRDLLGEPERWRR